MRAEDICRTAADLVAGDRGMQHGDKHRNHANIVLFWNAYMRARFGYAADACALSAADVASMMELLKVARRCLGAFNIDDYIDAAGYAACAGEIASHDNA